MTDSKTFRVIDIPVGSTAEEMESILNSLIDEGYYLVRLAGGETNGFRAIYKLRAKD